MKTSYAIALILASTQAVQLGAEHFLDAQINKTIEVKDNFSDTMQRLDFEMAKEEDNPVVNEIERGIVNLADGMLEVAKQAAIAPMIGSNEWLEIHQPELDDILNCLINDNCPKAWFGIESDESDPFMGPEDYDLIDGDDE